MEALEVVQLAEGEWTWACGGCGRAADHPFPDEATATLEGRRHVNVGHPENDGGLRVHPVEAAA